MSTECTHGILVGSRCAECGASVPWTAVSAESYSDLRARLLVVEAERDAERDLRLLTERSLNGKRDAAEARLREAEAYLREYEETPFGDAADWYDRVRAFLARSEGSE